MAMRSPISDPFARFQNAERLKRAPMMQNHVNFFKPWEAIHESNPQEILERGEPIKQSAIPHHAGSTRRQRASGYSAEVRQPGTKQQAAIASTELFEGSEHEWVAAPGPQTDRARAMVKAFIARQLKT